jgi:glycosyltransferase involved in cell wall biosynthesis
VAEVVADHHALLHASFFEGLPNVVCEALSLGKPVVLSNVCDHPYLVAEGERGFLFDPHDPASIADALGRLAAMEPSQWRSMSQHCRDYAIRELEMGRMLDRFEEILRDIVAERSGKPR